MADGSGLPTRRFSAFISYSSDDAAFARRLHRRLESYRLPRRLGLERATAAPPARLKPIFRDIDELSATHDLSTAVREALAESDFLIVICSPRSASSEWVGREIEYFRAVHGDGRILASLIEGDPGSSFHPALLHTTAGRAVEPLAADFRKDSGFRRLAMLKLVAALADVELDQLVQRDAQRATRRVVAAAAAAVAVMGAISGLSWMALDARAEAIRKGEQATGLVEYILTDVRGAQERSGRLADLARTNERVLGYFKAQRPSRFTVAERIQQAKLLQAMGEDDEKRGDLKAARGRHAQAHAITAGILEASPNDTGAIFAHAQSEYWVGYIDWREGRSEAAHDHFRQYAALADRLVTLEPGKPDWRHEVAYSELNLGTYLLRHHGDGVASQAHFERALQILQDLSRQNPSDESLKREIADAHAWIADSQKVRGELAAASESRAREREILDALLAADRENVAAQRDILGNELAIARLMLARGQIGQGLRRLQEAKAKAERLFALDPDSAATANQLRIIELFEVRAQLSLPQLGAATRRSILATLGSCEPTRPTGAAAEIAEFCQSLRRHVVAEDRRDAAAASMSNGQDKYSKRWGIDLSREQP